MIFNTIIKGSGSSGGSGNDRLVDVNELPLVESTSDNLVYKTPVKYTDAVYLVKSEPRKKTINVIPYQVTETKVTAIDSGGVKMSGVVVIAGHTTVTSPVAVTETSITIYADMDGEWVYTGSEWLPFTNVLPSEFDASTYKGMTYDVPTTSSTAGLYLHFNEQYAPRKVTVTNVSDQYAAEGGSITVIYVDSLSDVTSPVVSPDELNPILYVYDGGAVTYNGATSGAMYDEWCAPALDSFFKGKVSEPPTKDSADGVYFVRSVTPVSFGIPITNADIFQNIEGTWKQLGHRRVVDASKFPRPGETGVSGGGASKTFCHLFTVDSGAINDWTTIYRTTGGFVNIIIVDDHTSVESPIEGTNGTEITFYADNTNIWQYSNGAWSQGLGDRVYHGVVSTVPTESSPNGTYIYNQVIPYNRLKAEVIFGNKESEYTLSAAIGEKLGVPCSTILVDNHANVGNPVESNETNICVYADETGAWAYADGAWVDVLAMLTGATVPYLGIVVSPFDLSNFGDTIAYTYVQEAVNGSIWMVGVGMCMDVTMMLEAELGLHTTSYTVVSDHTEVTSPEAFDMTTMSGPVYVDDTDIWAYVPDNGGWIGLFYGIMGNTPETMPFFNVTEPPTSSSPSGWYFVPVELSTGDGTVDPNFVPYDEDLIYKVTTKEGETNLYRVYDIGNGTIRVHDERKSNAQFSGTLDFIFVDDHTAIEDPIISRELNSTTYYVDGNEIWYFANPGGWFCKCSSYSIVSEPPTVESAIGYYLLKAPEKISFGVAKPNVNIKHYDGSRWNTLISESVFNSDPRIVFMDNAILSGSNDEIVLEGVKTKNFTTFTIPEFVTEIGDEAFYKHFQLKSVEMPDSVTKIGNKAFYHCSGLSEFPIGEGITEIGSYAYYCVNRPLTLHIPDSVVSIGDNAFMMQPYDFYPSELTTITFGENSKLETIGRYAFFGFTKLTSIDIPSGLTSIGENAFTWGNSLTDIYISDLASWCNIIGLTEIMNPMSNVTISNKHLYLNGELIEELIIPDSVTEIQSYAFAYCTDLTRVVINNNVTSIGESAFKGCANLLEMEIGSGVTDFDFSTLQGLKNLTNIYVDENNPTYQSIDGNVYEKVNDILKTFCYYTPGKTDTSFTMPQGVVAIKSYAFSDCDNLINVDFSAAVDITSLSYTFNNCNNLTNVTLQNGLTYLGSRIFNDCDGLVSLEIPESVTEIGNYAFYACNNLTNIEIPDGILKIGSDAFYSCPKIKYTQYDSCKYLGNKNNLYIAVMDTQNTSSSSYTVHENAKIIASYAFENCSAMKFMSLPDSIVSINDHSFYDCSALSEVVIGNAVVEIEYMSFGGCKNLVHVFYKGTEDDWNNISIASGNDYLINATRYYYSENEPPLNEEGTDYDDNYWHYAANGEVQIWDLQSHTHTEVVEEAIPATCTTTGLTEGKKCSVCGKILVAQKTIPARGHTEVIDAAVPATCTTTGLTEGKHCSVCGEVLVQQNVIATSGHNYENNICTVCGEMKVSEGLLYTLSSDGTSYSVRQSSTYKDSNLVVPSTYEGKPVTFVDNYGFQSCSSLTNVMSLGEIIGIGNSAFSYCDNLTSVVIPDSVTSIGSQAFANCGALKSVVIGDSVTSIGDMAFYNCCRLTSVEIPDSVTSIGVFALYNCASLTNVTIGNRVTSIDSSAFKSCSKLTSVVIPNSVTSIGNSAFDSCSSLTSVYITDIAAWCNILFSNSSANPLYYAKNLYLNNELVTELIVPDNVTTIGEYAFHSCYSLTSVVIPDSVTTIGNWTFDYCSNLTSVVIPDSVTSIKNYAFYYCVKLTDITYNGTKAQWNSITKETDWNTNTGTYTIHCTDGDIAKS